MEVALIFPLGFESLRALARTINKSGCKASVEGRCIVCESRDPAKLASRLANLSGVDSTKIARKVTNRFSDIIGAIVQAGSKVILQDKKFYVKVIQTAKADYVDRDIAFASAGTLVGKLAEINALPAKSEDEADCVVLAVIGKRSAYICIKTMKY